MLKKKQPLKTQQLFSNLQTPKCLSLLLNVALLRSRYGSSLALLVPLALSTINSLYSMLSLAQKH